jgi:T-complex protein 1 subunit theta
LIQSVADTGVKVLVAGSGIGEMALHYLNRSGILVVKVLSKFDLRRLCRVTGATPLTRLGPPMPEELGFVSDVHAKEIGSNWCTVFSQAEGGAVCFCLK